MPFTPQRRAVLQAGAAGLLAAPFIVSGRARAAAPITVHIVNTNSNSTRTLEALLASKGWLKEFGVETTTQNIADGSKLMGALVSGSSDICLLSGFGQVLAANEKGAPVKVIGGAGLLAFQAVFAKDPKIKSVKDLEGRTVGTGSPGALLHQLMVALLEKKGVDISKVRFVNIGSSAQVFRAVVAGVVDAGPALYDVYEQQAHYGVHSLTDGNCWTELPEFTYQAAYASEEAIAKKRDGLVRVLAAYGKMYRYISGPNSRVDYEAARRKGVGGDPKLSDQEADSEWRFIQKYHPYATDLVLDEKRIDYMQRLNVKFGVQKKMVPYDRVTDMSIARDAVKLLG